MIQARGHFVQGNASALPLADRSVDLVLGSPPYLDARTYGIGAQRDCAEWIDWMLAVTAEACRVSRGLVLWVCAGVTRDRCYQPGPEGLLYEWVKRGGQAWRPAFWHRVGIPGSGGKYWLRADVEYVLAFKRDAEWPEWSDNTANGHPPKWAPGGEMSNRKTSGSRCNQWGAVGGPGAMGAKRANGELGSRERSSHVFGGGGTSFGRRPNGEKIPRSQVIRLPAAMRPPVLANPGNIATIDFDQEEIAWHEMAARPVNVKVGGGLLGHPIAHENEAPYPVDLAAWFIRSHCRPGGIVLDPFSGSGTTVDAAWRLDRKGIGIDLRMNQCELGRRRLANPYEKKAAKETGEKNLFGVA
jgi:hypothetical protein